jgi:hypothetical protein
MKKRGSLLSLAVVLLIPIAFVACGKKDEKKNESGSAPSITCLQQNCDNSTYQNASTSGFSTYNDPSWSGQPYFLAAQLNYYSGYQYNYNYNYNTFQAGTFCGCQSGYTPVYNSTAGFGCVMSRVIQPIASALTYWTIQSGQQNFSEYSSMNAVTWIQQSSGIGGMTGWNYSYGYGANCTKFVAEACLVNQPDSCRGGSCQATVMGSTLGVCVK